MCYPCIRCGKCGMEFPVAKILCPRCKIELTPENPKCPQCGFSMPAPPGQAKPSAAKS